MLRELCASTKNKPLHKENCATAYCFFTGKNITYNQDLSFILYGCICFRFRVYFSLSLINRVNVEA